MLLRTPGESGAPQVVIQRVLGDQDPDFEKLKLADKVRELWMLPRRGTIRPWSSKATDIFALYELDDAPQPLREAPIHDSADGDELARPIRNIKAAQLQGIAEQNEGMTINVLARTNHELGLVVATDEIAYVVDAYLDMQATDAGIARNQTDAELMMFAQVNSKH
ncbi:hypothetical protein H4S02_001549 [Coemansia sp. RSA 2611]|nr:hypothetical protein H4S02_001549 [Coemansia sp. RSA 2611]